MFTFYNILGSLSSYLSLYDSIVMSSSLLNTVGLTEISMLDLENVSLLSPLFSIGGRSV